MWVDFFDRFCFDNTIIARDECKRIDRMSCQLSLATGAIYDRDRITYVPAFGKIIRMDALSRIDLEMEVVSIGVSCVPDFPKEGS